jgi:hypothetical protein
VRALTASVPEFVGVLPAEERLETGEAAAAASAVQVRLQLPDLFAEILFFSREFPGERWNQRRRSWEVWEVWESIDLSR